MRSPLRGAAPAQDDPSVREAPPDTLANSATPPEEPPSLRQRLLNWRSVASFAVAAVLLAIVVRSTGDLTQTFRVVASINPWWYALAFVSYALTFPFRGLRWKQLLENVGYHEPAGALTQFLFISWFINCIVPAKIGDVYRAYLLRKHCHASGARTMGTILAERVVDTLALLAILSGTAWLVLGHRMPRNVQLAFGIAIGLSVALIVVIVLMKNVGARFFALFSERVLQLYLRFEEGTLRSFQALPTITTYTLLAWAAEAARVYCVSRALDLPGRGIHFGFPQAAFLMVVSSLLTLVPTPGGLGAVELGMAAVLRTLFIPAGLAGAAAITTSVWLLDRLVSYWSLIAAGAISYAASSRSR